MEFKFMTLDQLRDYVASEGQEISVLLSKLRIEDYKLRVLISAGPGYFFLGGPKAGFGAFLAVEKQNLVVFQQKQVYRSHVASYRGALEELQRREQLQPVALGSGPTISFGRSIDVSYFREAGDVEIPPMWFRDP